MIGDRYAVLCQVFYCLVVQVRLPVAGKVFEMCLYDRHALLCNGRHHSLLIIGRRFPLCNGDRAFRAGPDTGAETIAEDIAYEPGFPVNDLQRPFRAVRDALAASRAFRFVDTDDLPFHDSNPLACGRVPCFLQPGS